MLLKLDALSDIAGSSEFQSRMWISSTLSVELFHHQYVLKMLTGWFDFSFANAVLTMKPSDGGYAYNRTLAHILVEYASAVSSPLLPLQCATTYYPVDDDFVNLPKVLVALA
jgi:hypothetical protein